MKAKLKGKIVDMVRADNTVSVHLKFEGKVDHKSIDARQVEMLGHITLKPLVADELKFGSTITVYITDEEDPAKVE